MTEQEAINRLKYRIETATQIAGVGSGDSFEDMEMAIAALDKQIPKKYERGLSSDVRCPICGTFTSDVFVNIDIVPIVVKGWNNTQYIVSNKTKITIYSKNLLIKSAFY